MTEQYLSLLYSLDNSLSRENKEDLHLKSMRNFLIHFHRLKKGTEKKVIEELIHEYFVVIAEENYTIDLDRGREIADKYIDKIGQRYSYQLSFKIWTKFSSMLFGSCLLDLALLITGVLSNLGYLPVATLLVLLYALYIHLLYARRHKIYGPRY